MRIAIIGAGWYGCHIARFLKSLGYSVTLFERRDDIMTEASGFNQNRLHQGFHYARDYETRMQSRDGFNRFLERYGDLTVDVAPNLYAVAADQSLIDFRTYKAIMASSGIEFTEVSSSACPLNLTNISGVMDTAERAINCDLARSFFRSELENDLVLGASIQHSDLQYRRHGVLLHGDCYDFLIDASWSKFLPLKSSVFFEPTVLFYYECALPSFALTLVDGPLASVYPTGQPGLYTLSSVTHTPLGQFASAAEAEHRLNSVNGEELEDIRFRMEEQISRYWPDFLGETRYLAPQLSIKTKPHGLQDNRACSIERDDRVFKVMSGKIDTIFYASERILSEISKTEELPWTYSSDTRDLSVRHWQEHGISNGWSIVQPSMTYGGRRLVS